VYSPRGQNGSAMLEAVGSADSELASEVFQLFPYGLLVMAPTGELLAANPAAHSLLPDPPGGWELGKYRCCDLLGCRHSPGPLADGCVTELAAAAGRRLPEMRVDVPDAEDLAVWVTAAPLGGESERIVVQVRRGDPRDRRRRTRPHWTGGPELRISALGRTRVESREGPIGGAWLEQRPGQLLKYLVCERGRVVTVDEIAAAIWPGAGRRALGSVRHFVHQLRDRIEPERIKRTPSSFVVARQGGYTLNRARVRIDADDFEHAVTAGLAAFSSGDRQVACVRLEEGLTLYCGDLFAEDPYHVWAIAERDRLRDLAARGLRALIELEQGRGNMETADEHVRHLAELEPYDPQVQRQLVSMSLRLGRRSEAQRRYAALRTRMLHEFGEELDFEIADLLDASSQLRLV
jgi:DNA-binding SARP family transcriptional activator